MFKHVYSKILIGSIAIICLFTSCSGDSYYNDLKDKKRIDALYESKINPYLTKLDYSNSLRLVDSIYAEETHPSIWADNFYYNSKSWMNNHIKNYQLSINYADTLLSIIERKKLQEKVSDFYTAMYIEKGNGYLGLNNYTKAYECYFKAKQLADKYNDNCVKVYIIKSIAVVLYNQQQFEEAKRNYFEVLTYMRKCSYLSENNEQQTIDDIALCYTKLHQLDSANYYYRVALKNIEKYRYTSLKDSNSCAIWYASSKGVVLGNLAKIFLAKNEVDSAIKLYKEAIYLNTNIGSEKTDAQLCLEQLSGIYLRKKQLTELKFNLDNLKVGLDTLPNTEAKLGWLEMMATYYQSTNNPTQEIKYYKEFIAFRDSLNLAKKGLQETTITRELKDKEQQFEITVLHKDNQLSKVYLWVVAIACAMAAFIAFLVYRSFRKTKQLNEEVNLQKSALEKANKDKDRILNVVAHDLRNPIGAIANFLDIAQIKYEHSEEEEQILKTSQQAAVHSLTLINDLLEINQMQDGQLTLYLATIDVEQLIGQSIEQLKYKTIAKQQTIRLQTNNEKYLIKADAEKLQRVFTNLIDNAIKFSFLEKEIVVTIEQENNNIKVKIIDAGMGIPAHIMEQLFTSSITTKRKGTNNEKSNGLGLSICKQIIEAHNGKILVESEEGKGTCFTVLLPIS